MRRSPHPRQTPGRGTRAEGVSPSPGGAQGPSTMTSAAGGWLLSLYGHMGRQRRAAGSRPAAGYSDGGYHPEHVCRRDQMAVYVARAFQLPV